MPRLARAERVNLSQRGSWYSTRTLPWKMSHADKPFFAGTLPSPGQRFKPAVRNAGS